MCRDLWYYYCKKTTIHWRLKWWLTVFSNKVFCFVLFYSFFRVAPAAYGSSLSSWLNWGCSCQPTPSSQQCQILNPLSMARDQTCILMGASQIHFHWTMIGTPHLSFCHTLIFGQWLQLVKPTWSQVAKKPSWYGSQESVSVPKAALGEDWKTYLGCSGGK